MTPKQITQAMKIFAEIQFNMTFEKFYEKFYWDHNRDYAMDKYKLFQSNPLYWVYTQNYPGRIIGFMIHDELDKDFLKL